MEAWRGYSSLCPFKRGATGADVPFHDRFRSREIFGGRRIFARISPNFHEKLLCNFYLQMLSHKDHEDLFGVTSEKGLHVIFCKPRAPFFEVKQGWAPFQRGFSGMLTRFSANKKTLDPHLQQAPLFLIIVS